MNAYLIIILAVCIIAGLIPALIARYAGRDFLRWWVYGTVLLPVALVHSIMLLTGQGRKSCGYCRKKVKFSATHCPKCGYEFIDLS